ncbi:MAG: DinB family protein [Chloroflexota bacterium]|nr:DinB family protein [Chloroflexota bacterium]
MTETDVRKTDATHRKHLLALLAGIEAHMTFEEAVADFPDEAINRRAPNVTYSPWQLLEHIRLTQADILDYVINPGYVDRSWPGDYWPQPDATATPAEFAETIRQYLADREALADLVKDRDRDLLTVVPNSPGHTLLREVRIAADHTAYHVGEFAILRQVMGTWPPSH